MSVSKGSQMKAKVLRRVGLNASCGLLLALSAVAIPGGYCYADEAGDLRAITQFASSQLSGVLKNIPLGEEAGYGFRNRLELEEASLGIPYQEYDMDKETPTGYWRVPVKVGGENRALLRLQGTPDGWVFAGLGGADLARNLGEEETKMSGAGQTPKKGRIIRDFSLRSDYVQFDQKSGGAMSGTAYPLKSGAQFISDYEAAHLSGNGRGASSDSYGGYDLNSIRQMRLKIMNDRGMAKAKSNSGEGSGK
jgi:hypothetical protein